MDIQIFHFSFCNSCGKLYFLRNLSISSKVVNFLPKFSSSISSYLLNVCMICSDVFFFLFFIPDIDYKGSFSLLQSSKN